MEKDGINVKTPRSFLLSELSSFFRDRNKGESHKKVYENKDFCNLVMPSEDNKVLEFNQNKKSDKAPFTIYADLECFIKKTDGCKNKTDNSSTTISYSIRFFNVFI